MEKHTLNTSPLVMGVINLTPDSFYVQSRKKNEQQIFEAIETMIQEGADIIDVGAQSTRPQSQLLSEADELERLSAFLLPIRKNNALITLSIDTFYSSVAERALDAGFNMVNDVSAGSVDEKIIDLTAKYQATYVCMHSKGTPQTRMQEYRYPDLINEVDVFFEHKIIELQSKGITSIILDPGIGFSKTREQSFNLLKNLRRFARHQKPMLVGLSRKSFIYKTLNIDVNDALNGTSVMNTLALIEGAHILRVHDVKEAKEVIRLVEAYKQ